MILLNILIFNYNFQLKNKHYKCDKLTIEKWSHRRNSNAAHTYQEHRISKRPDDDHEFTLLEQNLIGARNRNNTLLFPNTPNTMPFDCPHVEYPSSYILLCEGRWRTVLDAGKRR